METKFFVSIIIICAALILISAQVEGGALRSGFGEPCDHNLKCNKSQWLSCQEGICDCTKPDEMIFDIWKSKCVSKAGERCKFEVDETVLDTETVFRMFEKAECITNGQCGADGTCNCKPGFYEVFNGTCVAQCNFREECSTNEDCRNDLFLSCLNGVCACDSLKSTYSALSGTCIGLAGQKCLNGLCVDSAECDNQTNTCNCTPETDLYPDSTGFCRVKKSYGRACEHNKECLSNNIFLTCENGVCGCSSTKSYQNVTYKIQIPNPYRSEYYCGHDDWTPGCTRQIERTEERNECVGRANQFCNANSQCVQNATCLATGDCVCPPGFYSRFDGFCGVGYDEACVLGSIGPFCSDQFVCNQGKCACRHPKHQSYNQSKGKCVSIVHGPCSGATDCTDNTECAMNPAMTERFCKCRTGYVENRVGGCEAGHGTNCEYGSGSVCDRIAGLQCLEGVCQCPDESEAFNEKLRKCVGLVGSRCTPRYKEPVCVNNAACVVPHSQISGSCQCNDGFDPISNRLCRRHPSSTTQSTTSESTTAQRSPWHIYKESPKDELPSPLTAFVDSITIAEESQEKNELENQELAANAVEPEVDTSENEDEETDEE